MPQLVQSAGRRLERPRPAVVSPYHATSVASQELVAKQISSGARAPRLLQTAALLRDRMALLQFYSLQDLQSLHPQLPARITSPLALQEAAKDVAKLRLVDEQVQAASLPRRCVVGST